MSPHLSRQMVFDPHVLSTQFLKCLDNLAKFLGQMAHRRSWQKSCRYAYALVNSVDCLDHIDGKMSMLLEQYE